MAARHRHRRGQRRTRRYNERARRAALDVDVCFIDVWDRFMSAATALGWAPGVPAAAGASATLWRADGNGHSARGVTAATVAGCVWPPSAFLLAISRGTLCPRSYADGVVPERGLHTFLD
ncbi:hypothetical protein ACW9HR_30775 [Nocardia gipuzkoensis]